MKTESMHQALKQVAGDVLEAFAKGRRCWSQFGEDGVIQSLFENQPRGFYVDVGAFAPKTFSNTYALYRRGWRGINIDPTPGSMLPFKVLRPRDVNLEVAVGEKDGSMPFYRLGIRSVLNTTSRETAQQYAEKHGLSIREVQVPVRRLASVLAEHVTKEVDLLSVDVEGADLAVLRSNDWNRWKPRVLVVEDHSFEPGKHTDVAEYLAGLGYRLRAWIRPTLILTQ